MKGSTHESLLALNGYTMFFQLLLAFVRKYPDLQRAADKRVSTFLKSEMTRTKRHCPNLGEWLPVLAISSYEWEDVAATYLKESFE